MITDKTVVISCAGMGTRLGMGMPKSLVQIAGKPLIARQLECLHEVEDVRVVVGYQAERVIDVVRRFREDVTFCFNYDYKVTGTGASLTKGLLGARDMVMALDGDLLVAPSDLRKFISLNEECIAGCEKSTDNPVLMTVKDGYVTAFSREEGDWEWTGLALVRKERLKPATGHVYHMLEDLLPIKGIKIRTREVDTVNDYERAVEWVKNNYKD